jgi:hypothetical protein
MSAIEGEQRERLLEAAEAVLADPVFVRSPTLCTLLRYLVAKTISGDAEQLKSFTVALDGLGRDASAGSPDAYARVQVGRLRKALSTYNEMHPLEPGGTAPDHLLLEPGSYVVRLKSAGPSAAEEARNETPPRSLLADPRRRWPLICACVIALLVGGISLVLWQKRAERQHWRQPNFPTVAVVLDRMPGEHPDAGEVRRLQYGLIRALNRYDNVRSVIADDKATFEVHLLLPDKKDHTALQVTLVHAATRRLVWSKAWQGFTFEPQRIKAFEDAAAFELGHATGVIATFERQHGIEPDSPYGCWLRFSALLQTVDTLGDRTLEDCARKWRRHAPDHPAAMAVYTWTETSEAVLAQDKLERHRALDRTLTVATRGEVLNPRSALLRLSAMRAYAFTGDQAHMIEQAHEALTLNGQNADVVGMVGLLYAYWGMPEGADYLRRARASNSERTPWYDVGFAVDAMRRDDIPAMRRSLAELSEIEGGQVAIALLLAAYDAKTGNYLAARSRLARASSVSSDKMSRGELDRMLDLIPLSPQMRSRFLAWLGPALR